MTLNIKKVGVVGAGQMGNGIAHVVALAGYDVLLNDVAEDRIQAALATIDGKIPMIVELKSGGDWKTLCPKTLELLRAYKGDYCVESFHPLLVRWFYLNAPEILRGQLSEAARYSRKGLPLYQAIMMSRLFTNILAHPHFIAYRVGPKCLSVRISEWLGAMRVCWSAC